MADVGILGGTFNPPHIGHLLCARAALDAFDLDRVLLMPVHTPPHKEAPGDPGASERVELCRVAVEGEERIVVSDLEAQRPGPSYTAATLRALREGMPQDELTFIVGADMALNLPTWREPEAVLTLARLAVAERGGAAQGDIVERLASIPGGDRVRFFDMPRLDISSSDIRRRVAAGRSIRWLVPDAVAERIAQRGLYAEVARDD